MKQETIECEIRMAEDETRASPGRLQGVLLKYGAESF